MKQWLILLLMTGLLTGARNASAKEVLAFDGVIDFQNSRLEINCSLDPDSAAKTVIKKTDENKYHLKFDVSHLNAFSFDFSSEIEGVVEIKKSENSPNNSIIGTVWSNYSMVDFRPVKELSGSYKIENNQLIITNVSFGSVGFTGLVDLTAPYKLDFLVDIAYMPMADFLKFWMQKNKYESSGGEVVGQIKATGTLDQPYLKGNFKSYGAKIIDYNLNSIVLNVEGVYPHFTIDNTSSLSKADGMSFTFNGPINIDDAKNLKRQIKSLKVSPLVKESDSTKEWTIKRFNEDGEDSAELKYFMRKEGVVGSKGDEETALFGIERSMPF
ncbi:MAG: hypothetical protein AB7S78_06120 [Candidatus Omnitrophota bacterium]